jgi:hypothetical protein
MKPRHVFLRLLPAVLLFLRVFSGLYAQDHGAGQRGDADVARQYADWARQAIDDERWEEALAALERAADFANVSSDISYLLALALSHNEKSRTAVVHALDAALETNRWVTYSKNHALLLKAQQLVAMREYIDALFVLDKIVISRTDESADAAILRLMALRGLAASGGDVQAPARFRSLLLIAMDRYPRDPRPLRVFFEYARNRSPEPAELPSSDTNLLELALRRLPFLLESDPGLAWMAAPFMRNTDDARRLVAAYRAQNTGRPTADSIPAALNFGILGDIDAVNEFFSWPVLEKNLITDVFNLLGSEEGRNLFTGKLHSFSGGITADNDRDGFIDGIAVCVSGVIREFAYDVNQTNDFNLRIFFDTAGVPIRCEYPVTGLSSRARINWERYPSVMHVTLAEEIFEFRPADFQFAPVTFVELGGSRSLSGFDFPVPAYQYMELTRRSLVSFCASVSRPSVEIDGATERIFLERGIPLRAVETLNGKQVSITEFERGAPLIQLIDLDLDGRMETMRRFRRPPPDFPLPDLDGTFDFRRLVASSESDWTGEGLFKTGEVYLPDGSVVYTWDMDGSGIMNYSETETKRE